jgi:nucleoside-diphosphate-sugar epimerase
MSFRILVTGASGFVGSALCSALAEAGHMVRGASRTQNSVVAGEHIEWMQLSNLEEEVDWAPFVDGMDIVIHLAAIAQSGGLPSDSYDRINRDATAGLVRACLNHNIKRLIFMSSIGAQTGSAADVVVTELDEPKPINHYGRSKLAAEVEIQRSRLPYTILRPVIVFGPGVRANFALLARLASLPIPLPFGAFDNERSLLSIDNLVEAVMFCLSTPQTLNQVFIVSDPQPVTVAEIFATLRKGAGQPARLFPIPPVAIKLVLTALGRSALWHQIGRPLVASSAKLQQSGWRPKVGAKEALQAMMRANVPRSGAIR